MKNALSFASLILITLLLYTCMDDDDGAPNLYEGCCDTAPGEYSLGDVNVYVPNAFTPDNNGINDLFTILDSRESLGNSLLQAIIITDRDNNEIFRRTGIQPNQGYLGWDGTDTNNEDYEGLFNYEITLLMRPRNGD